MDGCGPRMAPEKDAKRTGFEVGLEQFLSKWRLFLPNRESNRGQWKRHFGKHRVGVHLVSR